VCDAFGCRGLAVGWLPVEDIFRDGLQLGFAGRQGAALPVIL
jgi:hypothetical protein